MSRFSRPYVQTFQTQTLGATLLFGFKSRCGTTLGAINFEIFQTLCPNFPDSNSWRDSAIWVQNRMRRDPWSESCPDIPDILSIPSRLKFSARLCTLGLNPVAAQPVARFLSRLSSPYDETFKIQTLGATMPFESKSRCGATLGATHVQIFQTLCTDFPDSNSWRDPAVWV